MTHSLDGSRAKIARAGDHLEALDATLTRFVKNGGYRFAIEQDVETGEYVYRVYSNLQPPVPPPALASIIVGEVLINLRSALDHLVWQLSTAPSKANQFPIFDTPEGFKAKRNRYLRCVPKQHWAQIESYQPYVGRDQELAILATLNDVDKHRLLLAGATVIQGRGRFRGSGIEKMTIKGRDWVPFEDGAEVYRISIEAAGSEVKMQAESPYTIVFADPDSGLGASIQDLRRTRIYVSNVVESFAGAFDP